MARVLSAAEVASLGLDDETPNKNPKTGRVLGAEEVAALGLDKPEAQPRPGGPLLPDPSAMTPTADTLLPNPAAMTPGVGPQVSKAESAARGAAQGLSGGFADEAAAVMSTYGVQMRSTPNPMGFADAARERMASADPSGRKTYEMNRDANRQADADAQAANPKTFLGANLAGSLASPIGKVTGPGKLARVVGGGIQGGVYGAGTSEADTASGVLKDAGLGAGLGAGITAAGQTLKAGAQWAGRKLVDSLEQRILNEVAEGSTKTTNTARMKLNKAGAAITKEVVHGPDGDQVRAAALSDSAKKGVARLAPVIEKVGKKLDGAYGKFEAAGKDKVNLVDYFQRLRDAAAKANAKGDATLKRGIEAFEKEVREMAADSGEELTLRQLRGLTTNTQRAAASAMGALNLHAPAQLKNQISAIVSREMAATLVKQTGKDPALREAMKVIVANNPRYHALKTISEAIEQRAHKENTGRAMLVRGAEKISTPAAIAGGTAGITGALGGDSEDMLKRGGLALGAAGAAKAMPALARRIVRGSTTLGIHAARRPGGVNTAASLSGLLGQLAAKGTMGTAGAVPGVTGRLAASEVATDDEDDERRKKAAGVAP